MANYLKTIIATSLLSLSFTALANEEYRIVEIHNYKECLDTDVALYKKYKPLVNSGSQPTAFVEGNKVVITNGVKPFVELYNMPKIKPNQIGTKSQMVRTDGETYVSLECSTIEKPNRMYIWTTEQWQNKLQKEKDEREQRQKQREELLKSKGL